MRARSSISRGRRGRQGGYNMVMLMVAITVLNIMVAIALPMWSQEIQRDKEEELISRGWQYVEAIRLFQNRFQRPPIRLEELVEVKPRSIRRLWKDPMTDGKMQPIFQNEGQPLVAQPGMPDPNNPGQQNPDPQKGDPNGPKDPNSGQRDPNAGPLDPNGPNGPNGPVDANGDKQQIANGPISGVRSRSNKKSILIFYGKERYDQWRFTLDELQQAAGGASRNPAPGNVAAGAPGMGGAGIPSLSVRWLGRPSPYLQSPGNLPTPGDQMPGTGIGTGSSDGRKPPASGIRR